MSDATNFVTNKVLSRHRVGMAMLCAARYATSLLISGHAGILMQGRVCPTLFSVQKMSFFFCFHPALEPEILNSQMRTGNCCRVLLAAVVVILQIFDAHTPGFVRCLEQCTYLE